MVHLQTNTHTANWSALIHTYFSIVAFRRTQTCTLNRVVFDYVQIKEVNKIPTVFPQTERDVHSQKKDNTTYMYM